MQLNHFRPLLATFLLVLGFTIACPAQTSPQAFPNVNIKNFGQMDDHFYRGAQPGKEDFQALKNLGVNTVIDLRNDPTDYEKSAVEALGMKYINIPMSGWKYPKAEYIEQFLKLVNDQSTGVFYVHCKAGIHRTGIAGALYRFTKYGWNYDQAYQEMRNYNFSTGLVHGKLKDFIEDYAKKIETDKVNLTAVQNTTKAAQ